MYIDMTGDTHPMHTHLVTFQVIGRTPFNVAAYQADHGGANGVPGGIDRVVCDRPHASHRPRRRAGFKDTVMANPGFFTRVRAKFGAARGRHSGAGRTSITAISSSTKTGDIASAAVAMVG